MGSVLNFPQSPQPPNSVAQSVNRDTPSWIPALEGGLGSSQMHSALRLPRYFWVCLGLGSCEIQPGVAADAGLGKGLVRIPFQSQLRHGCDCSSATSRLPALFPSLQNEEGRASYRLVEAEMKPHTGRVKPCSWRATGPSPVLPNLADWLHFEHRPWPSLSSVC